jgi:hypothetical protein
MNHVHDYHVARVRVPVSMLRGEGHQPPPISSTSDLRQYFHNHKTPVFGIVDPRVLDDILDDLCVSMDELRDTLGRSRPLPVVRRQIACLLSEDDLARAQDILTTEFVCTVDLHCIPPGEPPFTRPLSAV